MKTLSFLCIFLASSTVLGQMISDLLQIVILDLSNEIKALRGEIKEYAKKEEIMDIFNKSLTEYATKEDIKEALNISFAAYRAKDEKDKFNIGFLFQAAKVAYIRDLGYVSLVKEKKNWEDSRDYCISAGGRLIEGLQREHFKLLLGHFGGVHYSDSAWVGIYNETWLLSGEKVNLNLYHNGQPIRGKRICGHFHFQEDCYGLGDWECVTERDFLCQYYA